MKCDHIRTRAQGDMPFFPNMLNNGKVEVCLKEDVDAAIDELKTENERLKSKLDIYKRGWKENDEIIAHLFAELRATRRALWMAFASHMRHLKQMAIHGQIDSASGPDFTGILFNGKPIKFFARDEMDDVEERAKEHIPKIKNESPELKKRIGKILESTKSFANNPFYIATKEELSAIAIEGYYQKERKIDYENLKKDLAYHARQIYFKHNRQTLRALWLARAERAKARKDYWYVRSCHEGDKRLWSIDGSPVKYIGCIKRTNFDWLKIWSEVECKCLKKMEKYK